MNPPTPPLSRLSVFLSHCVDVTVALATHPRTCNPYPWTSSVPPRITPSTRSFHPRLYLLVYVYFQLLLATFSHGHSGLPLLTSVVGYLGLYSL